MKKYYILITLILTTNLYSQWELLPTGTNMQFFSCSFVNPETGWAAGTSVYCTTNGGENWNLLYNAPAGDRLDCMIFKNTYTGWAGSYQGWIYKTTDGGHNWSRVRIWTLRIFDISFPDLNTGWAVGEDGNCKKTTNGGINWFVNGTFSAYDLYSVCFLNNNSGFIGGLYQFASTSNGGLNWNINFTYGNVITAINFINNSTGWALGHKFYYSASCSGLYILKTQDGGLNWNVLRDDSCTYGFHTRVLDAQFVTADIGYYCGYFAYAPPPASQSHILRKTTNGGTQWTNINLSHTCNSLEDLDFADLQTGYVAGYSGYIYKTTNGGPVALTGNSQNRPMEYSLFQNYPNPFNPSTKIKFDVPPDSRLRGNDIVTLKIYDVLGRVIATLVNEQLKPGTYETEWDASNYSSGVYFYRLIIQNYSETRKMVLIK